VCVGVAGLAAHVENVDAFKEPFLPLYFNYFEYAKRLLHMIAQEGLSFDDTFLAGSA
jgi:hypothetical protein